MTQISPVSGHSIEDLRGIYRNYHHSLDVKSKDFNLRCAKKCYTAVLQSQIEHPTNSAIAKWEMYHKYPIKNSFGFEQNYGKLINNPLIKDLKAQATQRRKSLYPKTADVRDILLGEKRVVFDKVTPALKGLKKIWLKMHLFV